MIRHRLLLAALTLIVTPIGAQPVGPGVRAPEIDLPALGGGHVKLSAMRGHPVVVSFWATWCPSCRTELPELVRAHSTHGPAGLLVLGVNGRDQEFSTKDVQRFVDQFALPFPVALDRRGTVRNKFLVVGLPTTVFIDSAGVVRGIHRGPIEHEELERGIAAIMPPG